MDALAHKPPLGEIEDLLAGSLTGWGVVFGPGGRIRRRVEVTMTGVWSEEHRALHLDERYTYSTGLETERRWVMHRDSEGSILAHDAVEGARMLGRRVEGGWRFHFDRPRAAAQRVGSALRTLTLDFLDFGDGRILLRGRARAMGLEYGGIDAALVRLDD